MNTEKQMTLPIHQEDKPSYKRKGINEIHPRIFQRGQIMSWSLDEKRDIFKNYRIGMVINFWSKMDSDMSACEPTYIYCPTPSSIDMLLEDKLLLAEYVAKWLENGKENVLILCEAGKTRSVFFTILLVSRFLHMTLKDSLNYVASKIKTHSLKKFMLSYIEGA